MDKIIKSIKFFPQQITRGEFVFKIDFEGADFIEDKLTVLAIKKIGNFTRPLQYRKVKNSEEIEEYINEIITQYGSTEGEPILETKK